MQFLQQKPPRNSKEQKSVPPNPLTDLQNHFSNFLQNACNSLQSRPPFHLSNPNNSSLKNHLELTIQSLGNQAKQAFQTGLSRFPPPSKPNTPFNKNPVWARICDPYETPFRTGRRAMSVEDIEERLAGIPVYALSNANEEFVLVSGAKSRKSLGLFCFREEDAQTLLEEMKSMEPGMRGSKVVPVALNKIFQLQVDGVAFRFIPDHCQIMNALKEEGKLGNPAEGFSGVPVFQSRSLVLRSQNKRYRPVFFRKEDLDNSLFKASREQKTLDPSFRKGDIQVCVLEEIIKGMKEGSTSKWDDIVFIPPGFDVSTNVTQ